jgi:hypothetical protein
VVVGLELFDEVAEALMLAGDLGGSALIGIEVGIGHLAVELGELGAKGGYVGYLVHSGND